jgi:hypothetical protein
MTTRLPGPLGRLQDAIQQPPHQPKQTLPTTVTGPLGTVAAAPIDTAKEVPEPRRLSRQQADDLMRAEMLAAIRSVAESSTELVGRLGRRGAVNGVMESWAGVFPTGGVITRTYEVAVGSVTLENLSAANKVIAL